MRKLRPISGLVAMTLMVTLLAGAFGSTASAAPRDDSAPVSTERAATWNTKFGRIERKVRLVMAPYRARYRGSARVGETIRTAADVKYYKGGAWRSAYHDGIYQGGTVTTARKLVGQSRYFVIARESGAWGYDLSTKATRNGWFKFHYSGYRDSAGNVYRGTTRTKGFRVQRYINADVNSDTLRFHGVVWPKPYNHKPIVVERKTCGKCRWNRVTTIRTNGRSKFSYKMAPGRNGNRWYYRLRIGGNTRFAPSFSDVAWATRYREAARTAPSAGKLQ